jgi:release factor glutamine methyltransferase
MIGERLEGACSRDDLTIAGLLRFAARRLASFGESAGDDALELLRAQAGVDRATAYAHPQRQLPRAAAGAFRDGVERRRSGEPVAYITGRRGFHAIDLIVDSSVLIPRPESEILVDEVLSMAPRSNPFTVLDVGTGSGALALAIANARRDAQVVGVDVSAAALALARRNARALGLDVSFIESDWLAALGSRRYDFIVCNPPYVPTDDPHLVALRHEPRLALDGGPDGLAAIRHVLRAAPAQLAPAGYLLLEHGFDQGAAVADLARTSGLAVNRVVRDLSGHERVTIMRRD